VRTLFWAGTRRAWGIGRPFRTKLAPWLLLGLALIPAVIALGVASLGAEGLSPFKYENYYNWVSRLFLFFCAAAAPELVCPDQRQRVLTLYFSRPLLRTDYVFARLGALVAALLVMALAPQLLLYVGHTFVAEDTFEYVRDNLDLIPRIVAAGLLIAVYYGAISLAISAYTTRRIYAAGGFIAMMLISTIVVGIIHETLANEISRYLALLAFSEAPIVAASWIFDASPASGLARSVDLPLELWVLATFAYTAAALFLLVRRYVRMTP
jgi:ABC-2 type transport system permease protein